jgi:hypothetical protein
MMALIERITREGHATRQRVRDEAAARKPQRGRPRAFVYSYRPPTKAFNLRLAFNKGRVPRTEIIGALEAILADLRQQTD